MYSFSVPYPRPSLFTGSQRLAPPTKNECRDILGKQDEELSWPDFYFLFCPGPAGTFQEVAYFLPNAIRYASEHPEDAYQYVDCIVSSIARSWHRIVEDKWSCECLEAFIACLRDWTASFTVKHCDATYMAAIGSTAPYADYLVNSEAVFSLLDAAVAHEEQCPLAAAFCSFLIDSPQEPSRAAWALEYARMLRCQEAQLGKHNQRLVTNHSLLLSLTKVAMCISYMPDTYRNTIEQMLRDA